MNLLKKLFGGNTDKSEKDRLREKVRNFDVLKYEGVRALKKGQSAYALECFEKALENPNFYKKAKPYHEEVLNKIIKKEN